MERDTHTTEVIFRIMDGKALALFPYSIYNYTGLVDSYMHVGQHSGAEYSHCIQSTKPAKEEQYADLKKELESIGYKLKVVTRRHYQKYLNALHDLK